MRHASLFSGIGGFDLAAQWMGWENVMQCEIDPFCQRVLRHHFPSAHLYGDIRQIDGNAWRGKIDVLTGGFPCQPFSSAGKRRGTNDDRFLWPEMLRIIREAQPTWVVAENVRGIVSQGSGVVFERVHTDLEKNGYEVQAFCIPACAVDAPHRRERIWFVAHAAHHDGGRNAGEVPGTNEPRRQERQEKRPPEPCGANCHAPADAEGAERELPRGPRAGRSGPTDVRFDASNAGRIRGAEGRTSKIQSEGQEPKREDGDRCHRAWAASWPQAATRLCSVDDGVSRGLDEIAIPRWKKESLKAYGNAIVPQVAYEIFKSFPHS